MKPIYKKIHSICPVIPKSNIWQFFQRVMPSSE